MTLANDLLADALGKAGLLPSAKRWLIVCTACALRGLGAGAGYQPEQRLLPAQTRSRGRFEDHARHRQAASGAPVRGQPDAARPVTVGRHRDRSPACSHADEAHGDRGDLPTLENAEASAEHNDRPGRAIASFGFAIDTSARVGWVQGEAAPMVVGTRLFAAHSGDEASDGLARAFARSQPIISGTIILTGAAAIIVDWVVDAETRLNEEGHFTGYFGRSCRPADPARAPTGPEAERIRQLFHDLCTPVTAVQGYAKVIQQQLFGPAPHEYCALAAAIAADSAGILAGFEEIDRLARLETGVTWIELG